MKKFFGKNVLMVLLAAVMACGVAYATDVATTWSSGDVREVNYLTPGATKTQLGTRLKGPLVIGTTTVAASSCGHSVTLDSYAPPTTQLYSYTSAAACGSGATLGNGYANQTVSFFLATDGGRDVVVTPTTKVGFSSFTLNDANDIITLRYIDDTKGWVVAGNNGATIN